MSSEDRQKRKRWSVREVKCLLKCYLAHKDEFVHSRKKRLAYNNVLEDMIADGFVDPSATVITLENKIRTLHSTYKAAKANEGKPTGLTNCFPFMEEMEEVFGDMDFSSNDHRLQMGISSENSFSMSPTDTVFTADDILIPDLTYPELHIKTSPPSSPIPQPEIKSSPPSSPSSYTPMKSPSVPTSLSQIQSVSASLPQVSNRKRRRKTAREIYYEQKLKIKQKLAENKMEERRRLNQSILEVLKDAEKKKLEMLKSYLK
ncbi:uncharacterized protein LOC105210793 [Zeugodacus cucurbitae]|uniref:Protein phosphatase 1 regulatory subunit 12C n=1 Tax=Zeugodacus cucurbitae TaxID=28588 RepID=A0A0A1X9F1_ZEUCU|nr:uncharacterized protein LOC105210793 [Zeugodacus cucurbitae]